MLASLHLRQTVEACKVCAYKRCPHAVVACIVLSSLHQGPQGVCTYAWSKILPASALQEPAAAAGPGITDLQVSSLSHISDHVRCCCRIVLPVCS